MKIQNKFLTFITLLAISFIVNGCTAGAEPKVVYTPALNKISTAEVGQNMYSKIYAIYLYENTVKIVDETIRHKIKENSIYGFFYFNKLQNGQCAMIDNIGHTFLIDENCDGFFTKEGELHVISVKEPIQYKVAPAEPIEYFYDSFKYDVLYQGKVGNKLNITFQEFVYSPQGYMIIRDAYTQNIQYEIDSNGEATIGFKGLRIKVLKATNLNITYQVVKDYD